MDFKPYISADGSGDPSADSRKRMSKTFRNELLLSTKSRSNCARKNVPEPGTFLLTRNQLALCEYRSVSVTDIRRLLILMISRKINCPEC